MLLFARFVLAGGFAIVLLNFLFAQAFEKVEIASLILGGLAIILGLALRILTLFAPSR